jgi:hypothetical protein
VLPIEPLMALSFVRMQMERRQNARQPPRQDFHSVLEHSRNRWLARELKASSLAGKKGSFAPC